MNRSISHISITVFFILCIVILAATTVSTAYADGTVYWDGNDDKNLPCPSGARWNMAPGNGIDSAVIHVNGTMYDMAWQGNSSLYADSDQPINVGADVYVEYVGAGGQDYHIELLYCLQGDATPTFTPVIPTRTPTSTSTLISPTNTPTYTPSVTPTDDPSSPTPTNTTDPNNPTATPTITQSPPPSVTNTPTQTSTPILVTATNTPYPPRPAVADDIQTGLYPGKNLGAITIGESTYQLFSGVNDSDGSLMLPSNIRGAAFYNNTIWIHRLWRIGYLSINMGDVIVITSTSGEDRNYQVIDSTYMDYGIYPKNNQTDETYQYIATCFSNNNGEWIGVELYKIKLVDGHPKEDQ